MIRDCRYQVVIVNTHRSGQDRICRRRLASVSIWVKPSYDDSFNDLVKRLVDGRMPFRLHRDRRRQRLQGTRPVAERVFRAA